MLPVSLRGQDPPSTVSTHLFDDVPGANPPTQFALASFGARSFPGHAEFGQDPSSTQHFPWQVVHEDPLIFTQLLTFPCVLVPDDVCQHEDDDTDTVADESCR